MVKCYSCKKEIVEKKDLIVKYSYNRVYPTFLFTTFHTSCLKKTHSHSIINAPFSTIYERSNFHIFNILLPFFLVIFGMTYFLYAKIWTPLLVILVLICSLSLQLFIIYKIRKVVDSLE